MDKIIIFTFIMVLALFACSSEPEWKFIRTLLGPSDNGDYDLYIKVKSIIIEDSERKVWIKSVYKKEQKLDSGKVFTERLVFVGLNCSKQTIQVFEFTFYGPDGSIVDSKSYREPPNEPITPGTVGEYTLKFVCK